MINHKESPSYRRSVRQLQQYLYVISQTDPDVLRTNPDGIYSPRTADAVSSFQKKFGLRPTGRVDYETWRKLLSESRKANQLLSAPAQISPFSAVLRDGMIREGDVTDTVLLLQIMLRTLSLDYDEFSDLEADGIFGTRTAEAVRQFQRVHGLGITGDVDLPTWNLLAAAYNKYVPINS